MVRLVRRERQSAHRGRRAAVAALLVALGSGINDLPVTWDWLSGQRRGLRAPVADASGGRSRGRRNCFPSTRSTSSARSCATATATTSPSKRGGFETGVDRATASRIFARYYLLPAIQVDAPDEADVVFTVGVDPHSLGVPLARVQKFSGGNYFAARVRR